MTPRYGLTLSLLLLAAFHMMPAGSDMMRFDPKAYPSGSFQVSRREYQNGPVSVRVIQAKRIDGASGTAPSYCRAWLEAWRGNRFLLQFYFDDIEPLGGSYGIFVPPRQPFTNDFIAVKEGDYDGRLLLISTDGIATNLPGGPYFVTSDKQYLIGLHSRGSAALVVVDVAKRRVVLDGDQERLPEIHSWYSDDGGYFFTEVAQTDNEGELRNSAYRLDLEHLRIAKVRMPPTSWAAARKIDYDFTPPGMAGDCGTQD